MLTRPASKDGTLLLVSLSLALILCSPTPS